MMLASDEAHAIERGIDGAHFFGYSLGHYYGLSPHSPGLTDVWQEFEQHRDETGFARHIVRPDQAPLGVRLLQEGLGSLRGAIGSPAQVEDLIARYEAAGVDQVIFTSQSNSFEFDDLAAAVPEPSSWAMLIVGLAGLGALMRGRRRPAGAAAA